MLNGDKIKFAALIDDVKAHGMNSIMVTNGWAARDAAMLSVSDAKGIDVYIGGANELARQWWPDTIVASEAAALKVIQPIVDLYAPHPSHKGYYVVDEPNLTMKDKVALATKAFQTLDPTSREFPVLIGLDRIGPIFTAAQPDTMVLDVYPAASQNAPGDFTMRAFGYTMDMVSYIRQGSATGGSAPLWTILQTHGNVAGLRYPTVAELRTQAFLSIGEGAKGIFWFIYSSQQGWVGLKDNPALYNEVASINGRIARLAPTLLKLEKTTDAFTASSSASVYVSTMTDGLNSYVVVVNRDAVNAATVTVSSSLQGSLQDLESNAIHNLGGSITLRAGDGAVFKLVSQTQTTTPVASTPTSTSTPVATSTPTPTRTPAPILTATPTPLNTATPAPTSSTTSAGVPFYPIDYTADVEVWWANHPFNPENPRSVPIGGITSPQPVVNVKTQFAGNIQNAINALPATGGTLYFEAGTYNNSFLLTKSNVHFVGATGAVLVGGNGKVAASALATDYPNFAKAVWLKDPAAIAAVTTNRIRNIYFKNLIFDGGGSGYVAVTLNAANGVVFDNITFRNYYDPGTLHRGIVSGACVLENIWFRGVHFVGKERWAVYLDGAHGSGVINSEIDANFGGGGLLFMPNDDFTRDYNNNGVFEPNEKRISNYVVIYGNTFGASGSLPEFREVITMSAANSLVKNNTLLRPAYISFVTFNGKASATNAVMHYDYINNRVVGNQIKANIRLWFANMDGAQHNATATSTLTFGKYQVRDNILTNITGMAAFISEYATWVDPKVIARNTKNGQPSNTISKR